MREERASGAKARVDFAAFAARLKSCPVTKLQGLKPGHFLGAIGATEVVP